MKRIISLLCVLLAFVVPASAAENPSGGGAVSPTEPEKAVDFSIDFSDDLWEVIIYGYNEAEYCAAHGISGDYLRDFLKSKNILVDAVHKRSSLEITVRRLPAADEIARTDGSELEALAGRVGEYFAGTAGCECAYKGVYEHSQTDFLVFDMTYAKPDGGTYSGIRYYTVKDGYDYYIDMFNYEGGISEKTAEGFESIVESFRFGDAETAEEASTSRAVWIIPAAAAATAVIIAMIAVRRRAVRRRKAAPAGGKRPAAKSSQDAAGKTERKKRDGN